MISIPKDRAQLGRLQLQTAGSVDTQVDNCASLPCGSSGPARHPLALTLDIDNSKMRCDHQGVQINARAIDLFPRASLQLTSDNGDPIPLLRDLLRDTDGSGHWDITLSPGRVGNEQILQPQMLDEFFDRRKPKGLPTGIRIEAGEVHHHVEIWHLPYRAHNGGVFRIPSMRGYGDHIIQTLANGTTAFRFGFDSYETEERCDALKLVRLSDTIRPF